MTKVERSKDADGENFPVGSCLIPPPLRKHVAAFYDYARTADDIADSPILSNDEKIEKLKVIEDVLTGIRLPDAETLCADKLRESLKETGVTAEHALDLLKAFRMDAVGQTYNTWTDLMTYCRWSAGSVGRFMLDLHGENPTAYWPSDAVCAALQLNNHLQDCKDDFLTRNRVYLPADWMKEEGVTPNALAAERETPALRRVFDRMTAGIDGLLIEGSSLPMIIRSRGLRMEVCVIFRLAQKLVRRLKKNDLLTRKVELTKPDWLFAGARGIFDGITRKKISCLNKRDLSEKK